MSKAVAQRDGLRFKKLDLHTHTPASKCFKDSNVTPKQIVEAAVNAGLDGIAITDHNSGALVDLVKEAASKANLVVFPGVEITCVGGIGGIHIIALFDPKCGRTDIESLLGNLELKPAQYGDINTIVNKDPVTVAKTIFERGGLAILAHANSSKGALHDMKGQQRIKLVQSEFICGAEATDFQNSDLLKKRKRVIDLLDGSDPEYQRKLAVYQASDNPVNSEDGHHAVAGIGKRYSYFKLDQINIDGLRQCLADPDVRIRQDFEFSRASYPRISKLRINGGFLDGVEISFHEGLNTILGSKGAGKSLLVEFLRFALNQGSDNPEISSDHESKLEVRLDLYSTVTVEVVDETGKVFETTREYNPAEGHPYPSGDHGDLAQLFPILFLSQNEIIKIAENENEQIRFIDRFLDFRRFQREIGDYEKDLRDLDLQLADSFRAYAESRQLDQSVVAIKTELQELDQKLKNPVFDKFALLGIKDRVLRDHLSYLKSLKVNLSNIRNEMSVNPPDPVVPENMSADPVVKRMQNFVRQVDSKVREALDSAAADLESTITNANSEYSKWTPTFSAGRSEYEETVHNAGGDYKKLAQRRAQRVKDLEAEELRLAAFKARADRVADIVKERNSKLKGLQDSYERFSKERQTRCEAIELQSHGRLKATIHEASNKEEFKRRLMRLKKGSWLKDAEIEAISSKSSPEEFVRSVIRFNVYTSQKMLEELSATVGIDFQRMVSLAAFLHESVKLEELLSLEHQALPQDRPEIRYNVGNERFDLLGNLSVGQKCTAMLIVALSEGTSPIVIDQPEDSLDIRSVWEDMCTKVRKGKDERQFIFTTHNSSLAVASDTDKFIVMESDATSGRVSKTGSMDHSPVRDDVIEYLEGGPKTYRQKSDKYRIDQSRN